MIKMQQAKQALKHLAMNVLNQFFTITIGAYGICGRGVRIGLNIHASEVTRHGVAHVCSIHDTKEIPNVYRIPFIVDKPQNLVNVNHLTIRMIEEQLLEMGFKTRFIQIEVDKRRKVYTPGRWLPIFNEQC